MADESDEDVIFVNSPLMKHLEEAGIDVTEEDVVKHSFKKDVPVTPKSPPIAVSDSHFSGESRSIFSIYLSGLVERFSLREEIIALEQEYKEKILRKAVKSKALELEDQQFLENFNEDLPKLETVTPIVMKSKMLFMVALPCVLAYMLSRIMYPDLPWTYKSLTDLSALCTLVYIFINIIKYCVVLYKKRKVEIYFDKVLQCFEEGENVVKYMQKSLRLIQESELISRGFTLVSQKSPVSRIEQSSLHQTQRQCPQLRATLFQTAKKCFLQLKSSTQLLVESCPLDDAVDNVMNYLCHIPLEEFGQCLQTSNDPDQEQLYRLTDGFSVSSLKGLKHLCHLQLSEFLRRMTLTYLESDISTTGTSTPITKILGDTTTLLHGNSNQLQRSYNIHSCCSINQEPKTPKVSATELSPIHDVYLAVHSLDLHLQAALLRIRSLSTVMEHQIEKEEQLDDEGSVVSSKKLLTQIKQELLACKACWEEGLHRVDVLMKPKGTQDEQDVEPTELPKPKEPKVVKQCGLEDPVIEDEVFEAYIDDDDVDLVDNTWDEFLSPEEKEKKRKEKEEALRVLTELKSVISVRAEDTAKREQAALQKTKQNVDLNIEGCKRQNVSKDVNVVVKKAQTNEGVDVAVIKNIESIPFGKDQPLQQDTDSEESTPVITPVNENLTENVGSDLYSSQKLAAYDEKETILKPRKQKYVYCPPEDEMATSMGPIPGPQFFQLPVLGKQEVAFVEERLERLSGANLSFASIVASQAVQRSKGLSLNMETFGGQDDDLVYDSTDDCKSEDSLDHDNDSLIDFEGAKDANNLNDSLQDEPDHSKDDLSDKCKHENQPSDIDDNDSLCGDIVDCKEQGHESDDSLEVNSSFSITNS